MNVYCLFLSSKYLNCFLRQIVFFLPLFVLLINTKITRALQVGVEPEKTKQRRDTTWPPHNNWQDMRVRTCNNCYNYGVDKILPRYR